MDCVAHGVAKSWTQLSHFRFPLDRQCTEAEHWFPTDGVMFTPVGSGFTEVSGTQTALTERACGVAGNGVEGRTGAEAEVLLETGETWLPEVAQPVEAPSGRGKETLTAKKVIGGGC